MFFIFLVFFSPTRKYCFSSKHALILAAGTLEYFRWYIRIFQVGHLRKYAHNTSLNMLFHVVKTD